MATKKSKKMATKKSKKMAPRTRKTLEEWVAIAEADALANINGELEELVRR